MFRHKELNLYSIFTDSFSFKSLIESFAIITKLSILYSEDVGILRQGRLIEKVVIDTSLERVLVHLLRVHRSSSVLNELIETSKPSKGSVSVGSRENHEYLDYCEALAVNESILTLELELELEGKRH